MFQYRDCEGKHTWLELGQCTYFLVDLFYPLKIGEQRSLVEGGQHL